MSENKYPIGGGKLPFCTLSDHELAAKADQLIDELIGSGGESFVMHVPARPNADPDLIFAELNNRFKKLITQPKPAGAVWVKGDKNFPVRKRVVAKMFIEYLNKEAIGFASSATGEMICFDWNVSCVTLMRGHEELQNLFWLDESGAGGNDAIEFAEWILEEEYYGEDGKWWMNAYSEGAESFTTADLYKLWQQPKSK